MERERWQQLEELYHAALEIDSERRVELVHAQCNGDESLRAALDCLLNQPLTVDSVFDHPAFEAAAKLLGADAANPLKGDSLIGIVVGNFRILEKLGAGGMGVVYKALDLKLRREVALKFLPEVLANDAGSLERFRHEARAASALNHPNICTIYHISEFQGYPFIAMEYLDGCNLKDHISGRALETDEISKLGIHIAEALAAAHSKGVIHRDVKPANIMVTTAGLVKVLDFGLAKLIGMPSGSAPTESLTETHALAGTLPYMSPEQLRGRAVDARTDIYALGVVLYEAATGQRPFCAKTSPQLIDDILNNPPPPPRTVNSKMLLKLEEIILKCLEKDPENRYQSAREVAVDLRRMTMPTHEPPVKTQPFLWATITALVLAISATAWIYVRRAYYNPIRSIAVLPFVDESKDPTPQYISDGITDDVIDRLSEISALKVMARNSAFRYKGKEVDAQSAGKKLGVEAVLTGRIIRQGDTLTLGTELVDVNDGHQIWGHTFRYSTSELSQAQEDLAAAVCDKLKVTLSSVDENRLGRRSTNNPEAYQLYLEARSRINQRTAPGILRSIELFQQAIEKDPNYALAYAGLANANNMSILFTLQSPREGSPKVKEAALKALELDPHLGEAYAELGLVKARYDYDLPGAQHDFKKALELSPGYTFTYISYSGLYLIPMGKYEEAIDIAKKGLALDPLWVPMNTLMAHRYEQIGDKERATQQYRHAIEMDPTFQLAHGQFAAFLANNGKFEQAIDELELAGMKPAMAAEFRKAFQTGGPKGFWQKNLQGTLKDVHDSGPHYYSAMDVASAYAYAGDNQKALDWLEKAYDDRDAGLLLVKTYPEFKNLQGDRRFVDLLKRMGLPEG